MTENRYTMENSPDNLVRLDQLDDWQLVDDEPDIRGWHVTDRSGDKLGSIDGLLVSTEFQETIFAIVSHGGILGIGASKVLVPTNAIDIDEENDRVIYRGSPDDIRHAPEYKDDTQDFSTYYNYWSGISGEPVKAQEKEMVSGRKGGEVPKKKMPESKKVEKEHEYKEDIKLNQKQSIEELSGGRIKKK